MKPKSLFYLFAIAAISFIVAIGCETANPRYPQIITPILVAQGELYGNGQEGITKQNLVIKTPQEWNNLLNAMNSVNNVSDNFAETEIDFNSYLVIAVFDEVRGNSGCSINIANIIEYADSIIADVHSYIATNSADVMNQPFYIVKIPVTNKNIVFNSSTTTEELQFPRIINPIFVAQGELYGNGQEGITKQNLVIKTLQEWNNLLNAMNSVNNVSNSFAETNIDFDRYLVIAVFDEVRGKSNCSISVTNVIEYTDSIVVDVHSFTTINGYTVMNQPFYIVKIPVTNKNIVFEETVYSDTIPDGYERATGYVMDYVMCHGVINDPHRAPIYNIISENLRDTLVTRDYPITTMFFFPRDFFINTSDYRYTYKIRFIYENCAINEIYIVCNALYPPPVWRHPNARPIRVISANFINYANDGLKKN